MMVWECIPRKCVAQISQTKFQMRSHNLHNFRYREFRVQESKLWCRVGAPEEGGRRVNRSHGASPSAWLRVKTLAGGALLQAGRRRGSPRAGRVDAVAHRDWKGAHEDCLPDA